MLASTALALLLSQTALASRESAGGGGRGVGDARLARVRVDARWDTDTRRLHVSVTRQRARDAPGTHADAPGRLERFRGEMRMRLSPARTLRARRRAGGDVRLFFGPSQSRDAADGAD